MSVKKKATKKAVAKKVSDDKLKAFAIEAMENFSAEAEARYIGAKKVYDVQDEATQDALERMTTMLCMIARKNMWVSAGGKGDKFVMPIPEATIYNNMFYLATEIMKDLAVMDVRVANYKFPEGVCAECGQPVKAKKKVKSNG